MADFKLQVPGEAQKFQFAGLCRLRQIAGLEQQVEFLPQRLQLQRTHQLDDVGQRVGQGVDVMQALDALCQIGQCGVAVDHREMG